MFAKEVRTGGLAFHSHMMKDIAPSLLRALKQVGRPPSGLLEGPPGGGGGAGLLVLTQRAVCTGDPRATAPFRTLAQHLHARGPVADQPGLHMLG